jgi:hypothetical protein
MLPQGNVKASQQSARSCAKQPPRRLQRHLPGPLREPSTHGRCHPSKDLSDELKLGATLLVDIGQVGGAETSAIQSRFVLSRKPKRRGVASHLAGAILFLLLGAIAATALYPHAGADRHSEDSSISDSRHVAALTPAPDAISDRSGAFASQDGAEYTGGPIPKPTFAAPQPVVATAAIEAQALTDEDHSASAANVGRPDQTGNKAIRKKEYGHRRNEPQY